VVELHLASSGLLRASEASDDAEKAGYKNGVNVPPKKMGRNDGIRCMRVRVDAETRFATCCGRKFFCGMRMLGVRVPAQCSFALRRAHLHNQHVPGRSSNRS
jgi:hypothetical protein